VIPRFLLVWALVAAILLPIVVVVLYGVGTLLGALGDTAGAWGVGRVALACGILWGVDLISLVIMLAIGVVTSGAPELSPRPVEDLPADDGQDEE